MELVNKLNQLAGNLPTEDDSKNWTSYGYYILDSNSTAEDTNPFACKNTDDKVFMRSWQDMINSLYGFNPTTGGTLTRTKKLPTMLNVKARILPPLQFATAVNLSTYSLTF